jgi:hypothetical protein
MTRMAAELSALPAAVTFEQRQIRQLADLTDAVTKTRDTLDNAMHSMTVTLANVIGTGFGKLDSNFDDNLTFEELKVGLSGIASDAQLQALIAAVDTNGDGRIDLNDNTALCCTDLLTNQESVLAGDQFSNSFPAFSPSGDSIVYLSRRRDTNNDGVVDALDNSGIYRLTLADRSEKMIVGDEHYAKFPAFSSDGKSIAFIASLRSDARQEKESTAREYFRFKGVYTCDPDGKNRREILSPQFYGCRFLAASPRANRVVFTAWRKDTNRGLYVAPLDALPDRDELLAILEENL